MAYLFLLARTTKWSRPNLLPGDRAVLFCTFLVMKGVLFLSDSDDGLFESAIYPTLDKLLAQSGGICELDGARRERPR